MEDRVKVFGVGDSGAPTPITEAKKLEEINTAGEVAERWTFQVWLELPH